MITGYKNQIACKHNIITDLLTEMIRYITKHKTTYNVNSGSSTTCIAHTHRQLLWFKHFHCCVCLILFSLLTQQWFCKSSECPLAVVLLLVPLSPRARHHGCRRPPLLSPTLTAVKNLQDWALAGVRVHQRRWVMCLLMIVELLKYNMYR